MTDYDWLITQPGIDVDYIDLDYFINKVNIAHIDGKVELNKSREIVLKKINSFDVKV